MSEQTQDSNRIIWATSIASSIASIIGKFTCHPLDTIKSKVQANTLSDWAGLGALQLMSYSGKKTWKSQGIKGFYRGVTLSAFGSMFAFSLYMSAYEKSKLVLAKNAWLRQYPALIHLISGFSAQFFSCFIWLPIDIIKQRMQVQSEVKIYSYTGPREAIKKIHSSEGIIGLYRALGATLLFFGPYSAIFFVCYEKFKKYFVKGEHMSMSSSIICSSAASAIAGFVTTPLELVKLRMQVQRADIAQTGGKLEHSIFGYKNTFHGLSLAYKSEGFLALFKGGGLRIAFVVPLTVISMSLTEQLKQRILRNKLIDSFV